MDEFARMSEICRVAAELQRATGASIDDCLVAAETETRIIFGTGAKRPAGLMTFKPKEPSSWR